MGIKTMTLTLKNVMMETKYWLIFLMIMFIGCTQKSKKKIIEDSDNKISYKNNIYTLDDFKTINLDGTLSETNIYSHIDDKGLITVIQGDYADCTKMWEIGKLNSSKALFSKNSFCGATHPIQYMKSRMVSDLENENENENVFIFNIERGEAIDSNSHISYKKVVFTEKAGIIYVTNQNDDISLFW